MAGESDENELVIVPARAGNTRLEVRLLADGTRTLPVFSSVARMVDELGPEQAWVCLPMRAAAKAASRAQVDRVMVDPILRTTPWPRQPR
ncbi:MAG TPA: SAV_915 family protein [Streptosporangiaceae bacterium]|jgi:CMP-2-keto-3-deoxyoctulosonic acid synthetase|nr:SAV_915 family protein [Streptosporangiaceae bacterium]